MSVHALSEKAFLQSEHRNIPRPACPQLRFLDARAIAAAFSGVLSPSEMRQLLQRRNSILEHLDRLVEQEGYAKVVLDLPGGALGGGGNGKGKGSGSGAQGSGNSGQREAASRSR